MTREQAAAVAATYNKREALLVELAQVQAEYMAAETRFAKLADHADYTGEWDNDSKAWQQGNRKIELPSGAKN